MNRKRCLGAATTAIIFLLVISLPDSSSPLGKIPMISDASAQSVSPSNETGWGTFSVTITSSNDVLTWAGSYTLAACTEPVIPQSGPQAWAGCGYAVASLDGTTSGLACDTDIQYLWSVYVSVGYNGSIGLEVGFTGPDGGEIALGCGPGNNFIPPPLIPTYCCNESGLAASGGELNGVATYSKTGTDAVELPGFTVQWSGMVSIYPAQVTTSSAPEFNANALALVAIVPLAVVVLITRRTVRKPVLEHGKGR
jgi:hypothetical protein